MQREYLDANTTPFLYQDTHLSPSKAYKRPKLG